MVRWHPLKGERSDQSSTFLHDLSALNRRRGSWEAGVELDGLEGAVVRLRTRYGPLRGTADSVVSWLTLAAVAGLHTRLERALADGGVAALAQARETHYRELLERDETDERETARRKNHAQRSPDLGSRFPGHGLEGKRIVAEAYFPNRNIIEQAELEELGQIWDWLEKTGATQTRAIRRVLAVSYLHNAFTGFLAMREERAAGNEVRCSVNTWLYEALSCVWRGGYPIARCAAGDCSNFVLPFDARTRFCSPACTERARRHRKNTNVRTATRTATTVDHQAYE